MPSEVCPVILYCQPKLPAGNNQTMTPNGLGKRPACQIDGPTAKRWVAMDDTAMRPGDGQCKHGGDADAQPEDITPTAEETRCVPFPSSRHLHLADSTSYTLTSTDLNRSNIFHYGILHHGGCCIAFLIALEMNVEVGRSVTGCRPSQPSHATFSCGMHKGSL